MSAVVLASVSRLSVVVLVWVSCLWVLAFVSWLSVVVLASVSWLSVGTGFFLLAVCWYNQETDGLSVGTGSNVLFAVVLALVSRSLVLASVSCFSVGTGFSLLVACGYCYLSHFCHWVSASVL